MDELEANGTVNRLRKFTPVERIIELFNYDQYTGIVTRKTKRAQFKAGSVVGTKHISGYLAARVDGNIYLLHRLIWCIVYGNWPDCYIDHIDGNKKNNIISNLREATHTENTQNAKIREDNTSGIKGVHYSNKLDKWVARVQTENKRVHLGAFSTLEEAQDCIEKFRLDSHKNFTNNGNYN